MNILFINKFLYPKGGTETYMMGLGAELSRRGHRVEYFGMEHRGNCVGNRVGAYTKDTDYHTANPVKKVSYALRTVYSTHARRQLRRVLEDLQPQYIVADPDMIYQVIYNLFDNAVKFTNEDGFIKVTLEDLGSQIRVSIKNSGAGIKAEELSRVFERFYKVDKSRSLDAKGAGLGLYIVKMMVEMHSGRIYAKSEDENTAEFVFTLPKAFTPVNKKGAKEA